MTDSRLSWSLSSSEWPPVSLGGEHTPYIDRVHSEDDYLIGDKTVVAFGTVFSIPWSLVAYELLGQLPMILPDGRQVEMPGGHFLQFFLGGRGEYGGANLATDPGDRDLELRAWSSDRWPDIVFYLGSASDRTKEVEIRPEGGTSRSASLARARAGWIKHFFFFPPPLATGIVVAMDSKRNELDSQDLFPYEILNA